MVSKTGQFESYLRSIPIDRSHEHAEALLLTCIDFRFFTLIAQKMDALQLTGKYDHFILAGASLGALLDFDAGHLPQPQPLLPRLHWQQVFLEHLDLATTLHQTIHEVIIIEHRECGAYKAFLKPSGYPTPRAERLAHKRQADKLERLIHRFHPKLKVSKWLAGLQPRAVRRLLKARPEATEELKLESLS